MLEPKSIALHALHAVCLVAHLCVTACSAQSPSQYEGRDLIMLASESPDFRILVDNIRSPATQMVGDKELAKYYGDQRADPQVYFRITQREYVLDKNGTFHDGARLGGTPFVFLTVPQAGYGRSLYQIYSDLGYDAEGVLRQRNQNMVAMVFRYPSAIEFSTECDGNGPLDTPDFANHVYVPTWKNAFALFARLAEGTGTGLLHMDFGTDEADQNMARFFPAERRQHIAQLPYALLRMAGGPDWQYRQLLENRMGMNSHFRGVGVTENTLSPADDRMGLPEYVGPNSKLVDLQDFAVIDLGRMEFREVHD